MTQSVPELRDPGSQMVLTVAVESNEPVAGKDVFTKGSIQFVDARACDIMQNQVGLVALRNVVEAVGKRSKTVPWTSSALPNMLRDAIGGGTLTRFLAIGDLKDLLKSSCLELLHHSRLVRTKPVAKARAEFQLKKCVMQLFRFRCAFFLPCAVPRPIMRSNKSVSPFSKNRRVA